MRFFLLIGYWLSACQPYAQVLDDRLSQSFVARWKITNDAKTLVLPLLASHHDREFDYSFRVDWGDGTIETITSAEARHTYTRAGEYETVINGQLEAFGFWQRPDSRRQLLVVSELGDVGWQNLNGAFFRCDNLRVVIGGDVSEVNDLSYLFYGATRLTLPGLALANWQTGRVTTMRAMFAGAPFANPRVDNWNTSQVTDMSGVFQGSTGAKPKVANWDTSQVTTFASMFQGVGNVVVDLSSWELAQARDLSFMFADSQVVAQGLDSWDTGQVTSMYGMFSGVRTPIDAGIASWNFANVRYMDEMFNGGALTTSTYSSLLKGIATTTSQTGVVLDAGRSEYEDSATTARQSLIDKHWQITDAGLDRRAPPTPPVARSFVSRWLVSDDNLTIVLPLVDGYNYDFNLDCGDGSPRQKINLNNYRSARCVYSHAGEYTMTIDGLLEAWSFAEIPDSKDQLLAIERLGSVGWKSFRGAFKGCSNLVNFSGGDTSSVTDMESMFHAADKVVPDTASWDLSKVTRLKHMFNSARSANPDVGSWDVSSVTDLSFMFYAAVSAKPEVSRWDVSQVTDLFSMFRGAQSADPDVSNWNTSKVVNMAYMFDGAISASPDVSKWDVSQVKSMSRMFRNVRTLGDKLHFEQWNFVNVIDMTEMFDSLSSSVYSNLLQRLEATTGQECVKLGAGNSQFNSIAESARQTLVEDKRWKICDAGLVGDTAGTRCVGGQGC